MYIVCEKPLSIYNEVLLVCWLRLAAAPATANISVFAHVAHVSVGVFVYVCVLARPFNIFTLEKARYILLVNARMLSMRSFLDITCVPYSVCIMFPTWCITMKC